MYVLTIEYLSYNYILVFEEKYLLIVLALEKCNHPIQMDGKREQYQVGYHCLQ